MLLTLILTLSHYLTLSLFLTLTLFQSLIESLLTCWTTFVFISMLKSHSHILSLSLSHSHSFSLSHSFNLSFNHSRHAEQVLFSSLCSKVAVYRRKLQCFFFDTLSTSTSTITLTCEFRVHRAGSQLKTIAIFGYKQRLLSIEMKTKLVQHVESEWMRDWKSDQAIERSSLPGSQLLSDVQTFFLMGGNYAIGKRCHQVLRWMV